MLEIIYFFKVLNVIAYTHIEKLYDKLRKNIFFVMFINLNKTICNLIYVLDGIFFKKNFTIFLHTVFILKS